MALERLTYDRAAEAVTYRSDKAEGPTAGTEAAEALECPRCAGAMRIVAFSTQPPVIAQILTHLRPRGDRPRTAQFPDGAGAVGFPTY